MCIFINGKDEQSIFKEIYNVLYLDCQIILSLLKSEYLFKNTGKRNLSAVLKI